jgi:hypothetical protein
MQNPQKTQSENQTYSQLCVMQSTTLEGASPAEFEAFIFEETECTIRFAEEVTTLPGLGGEGGRRDLFFWVANADLAKFAIRRLALGIRWWEDVLGNGNGVIYPLEILHKYPNTWQVEDEVDEITEVEEVE